MYFVNSATLIALIFFLYGIFKLRTRGKYSLTLWTVYLLCHRQKLWSICSPVVCFYLQLYLIEIIVAIVAIALIGRGSGLGSKNWDRIGQNGHLSLICSLMNYRFFNIIYNLFVWIRTYYIIWVGKHAHYIMRSCTMYNISHKSSNYKSSECLFCHINVIPANGKHGNEVQQVFLTLYQKGGRSGGA